LRNRRNCDGCVDRQTFHGFYEQTASALRAYLRFTCGNRTLADDLMQESYLRMLRRHLPELDGAQRIAYLYKTARSVLADHYRARRREARWRDEYSSPGATGCTEVEGTVRFEDLPAADAFELPFDMQRVFDTLSGRQQNLLWLAYVEGFRHEEIAEIIGVTTSSVKVLLSRARTELAARLGDQGLAPRAVRGGAK
jgi:RNA polymerase sigma factor (sigma-70 family)